MSCNVKRTERCEYTSMKVFPRASSFLVGFASAFLLVWLVQGRSSAATSSNLPRTVRPNARPLADLQVNAQSEEGDSAALHEVRTRKEEARALLRRSKAVEHGLEEAIGATREEARRRRKDVLEKALATANEASSAAAASSMPVTKASSTSPQTPASPTNGKPCPAGCTRHGNCDAVTGVCSCPPTYEGAACDVPTMPDCSTSRRASGPAEQQQQQQQEQQEQQQKQGDEDGFVNLSGLASEQFWWMLRDVKPDPKEDVRRRAPPFRWVGMVPCGCVRQALEVYSLQGSPEPAAWPRYIGHTEIAMQRAVCVDAPDGTTVGDLWADGGASGAEARFERGGSGRGGSGQLRWSYVALVAWLKPYPAHSPMILPPELVTEAMFVAGSTMDRHLMYLAHANLRKRPPPPPPPQRLRRMLPTAGRPLLRPSHLCGPHACGRAGWCGVWKGPWGETRRQCFCLREVFKESHELRMAAEAHGGRFSWHGPKGALSTFELEEERRRLRRLRMSGGGAGGGLFGGGGGGLVGGGGAPKGGSALADDEDVVATSADAATCASAHRAWEEGMERARFARSPSQMDAHDAEHDLYGIDRWRTAQPTIPRAKACPNECLGRGNCSYGFCHCAAGYWGLDCGLSRSRLAFLRSVGERVRPRVYVYEVPASLRRSCAPWTLPEDLGDRLLLSDHLEPDPSKADLFWVYGCPNGDTVLPMLRWIKRSFPFWNASVRANAPRHVIAVGHEEGWSEVWALLGRWLGPNFDHANHGKGWDDLHPASPTRQIASIQLHGGSDYTSDGRPLRRGVSGGASCRICFQPGKDVVVPGFPGIMDYPDDHGRPALYRLGGPARGERVSQCRRLARELPYADDGSTLSPRRRSPRLFMAGVVQTKTHGPGLYEASRLVPYSCWKNASRENDFFIRQTETVTVSVNPWEIEAPVDPYPYERHASLCAVPEGKIGSYGHRATNALMLGCVPLVTKELFSFPILHERINWSSISLHVPPAQMPRLAQILKSTDIERLRRNGAPMRRRLLWTSIYGTCHLRPAEGGMADAFDTLMEVLASPRVHFRLSEAHRAPRAPEMMDQLYPWLRERGGDFCTKGYQCFDQWRRSCFEKYS